MVKRIVVGLAVFAIVAGAAVLPASPPVAAEPEELFRPTGLDPDWPACWRSGGYGIDSVGCAVNDVPGGRQNADDYVFLHGRAFRSTGETIENLNAVSPFAQGEAIGRVSIGDHTGAEVGVMKSGTGGWWGVWVPVERAADDPMPPVAAWIAPMRSYPSLYNWIWNIPPSPPPFGAESEPVGLGAGNRAVRVDDLTMPGPALISSGCRQLQYTSEGATMECSATAQHPVHGSQQEYSWTWFDGAVDAGTPIQRFFPEDGSYFLEVEALAPDGWRVQQHFQVRVSECQADPCLEAIQREALFDEVVVGEPATLTFDVTNIGQVPLSAVTGTLFDLDPGLVVTAEPAPLASLAPGATAPMTVEVTPGAPGDHQFQLGLSATLPSGRSTGATAPGYLLVSGGDLHVELVGPTTVAVGETVAAEVRVTNRGTDTFSEVGVFGDSERPEVATIVVAPHDRATLGAGESLTVGATLRGLSDGVARVSVESSGSRNDVFETDRAVVEMTVGSQGSLVVNTGIDGDDADADDGQCDIDLDVAGGQCSLRAAIDEANRRPGGDTVTFALDDPVLAPNAPLPVLVGPAVVDGSGVPGLTLDARSSGPLRLWGTSVVVQDLHVVGSPGAGVVLGGGGGHRLERVVVGLRPDGTADPNQVGVSVEAPGSTLRGVTASGNAELGVYVAADATLLDGVVAGLDPGATAARGNGLGGLVIRGNANVVDRGVFTANPGVQVSVQGDANRVTNAVVGLSGDGVSVVAGQVRTVGGIVVGAGTGNEVRSNVVHGQSLGIVAAGGRSHVIDANRVTGSDVAGIAVTTAAVVTVRANVVGDGDGGLAGILVAATASQVPSADPQPTEDNLVQNNVVFDSPAGIMVDGAARTVVVDNWLGNNTGPGLTIIDRAASPAGTVVRNNAIGLLPSGTPAPNAGPGVAVLGGSGAVIGGTTLGDANGIFDSGGPGVVVQSPATSTRILGNEIRRSSGAAIDTSAADAGVVPAVALATPTRVDVDVRGAPGASVVVEVFTNQACDVSGAGEAETFAGRSTVTLDGTGRARATLMVTGLILGHSVSATATPAAGSTSEMSPCVPVASATTVSEAAAAGATRVGVSNHDGFSVGDAVAIDPGTASEDTARVVGFGSLLLDRPLRFDHPAGALVVRLPAGTDLAPVCPAVALAAVAGAAMTAQLGCTDEGPVTYALDGAAPDGISLSATGALTYTPPATTSGLVAFGYVARDARGQVSSPATVTVSVEPAAVGLRLAVTLARFVVQPRVPTVFALAGRVTPVGAASIACGQAVTVGVGNGLWSETIPGTAFRSVLGVCTYVRRAGGTGLVAGFTFDPRTGAWAGAGAGSRGALSNLVNPVQITLGIGSASGSATVQAVIR